MNWLLLYLLYLVLEVQPTHSPNLFIATGFTYDSSVSFGVYRSRFTCVPPKSKEHSGMSQ